MKIGNFEITADKFNFILTETYEGKDKDGGVKLQTKQSYYGLLEDALQAIVNKAASDQVFGDANTLIAALVLIKGEIITALKEQNIQTRKAA